MIIRSFIDRILLLLAVVALHGCGGGDQGTKTLDAPSGVALSSVSDASLTFTWNGVQGAESYLWRLQTASGASAGMSATTATTVTVPGLMAGITYRFSVQATGAGYNASAFSAEVTGTPVVSGPPATPAGVILQGFTTTSLTFSWSAVSGASSYNCTLVDSADRTVEARNGVTQTSASFAGLTQGEIYRFTVQAVNAFGSSSFCAGVEGTPSDIATQLGLPANENDAIARAFPGAEGGGMYATGGRGGAVYRVTKLTDDGSEGTLRWAVGRSGARTVIFDVGGVIALASALEIKNGNLTIAGQTAPGDGICIKNYPTVIKADNVVIRFMRFRMGDETKTADDAVWGREQSNIIIDHCSMSWSTDECSSFYDNTGFTMQWCILSESLRNSVHGKGKHGYGGIWGGHTASFHHNLLAHHDSRNPRMCGSRYSARPDLELVDFRNNVIYNWGANSGYAGEGGRYNFVNNYYKSTSASSNPARIFQPNADDGSNSQAVGVWGTFYVAGNYMNGSAEVTADNWKGINPNPSGKSKEELRSTEEFTVPAVTTHSAAVAYDRIRAYAGASKVRDQVDTRITNELAQGTYTYTGGNGSTGGLIDSQKDVGGWPAYAAGTKADDSDGDGIPDWFEVMFGLDRNAVADAKTCTLDPSGRYTNLEIYLHYLVKDIVAGQNAGGAYAARQ